MVVGSLRLETDVAIIGGGPGGYVAAIRAADLGLDVTLIEVRDQLGGVCLTEGCIPSKALINAVEVAQSAREGAKFGIGFSDITIDLDTLRNFTRQTVSGLTDGVAGLLERRGVQVVKGRASFDSNTSLTLEQSDVGALISSTPLSPPVPGYAVCHMAKTLACGPVPRPFKCRKFPNAW